MIPHIIFCIRLKSRFRDDHPTLRIFCLLTSLLSLSKHPGHAKYQSFNELQYNYSKLHLPNELLNLKKVQSQNLFKNLDLQISQKIKDNFFSLKSIIQLLNSNSIDKNLKKGYVLLKKYNKIIKRAKQLKKQDDIQIKFFDKQLDVKIKHS